MSKSLLHLGLAVIPSLALVCWAYCDGEGTTSKSLGFIHVRDHQPTANHSYFVTHLRPPGPASNTAHASSR